MEGHHPQFIVSFLPQAFCPSLGDIWTHRLDEFSHLASLVFSSHTLFLLWVEEHFCPVQSFLSCISYQSGVASGNTRAPVLCYDPQVPLLYNCCWPSDSPLCIWAADSSSLRVEAFSYLNRIIICYSQSVFPTWIVILFSGAQAASSSMVLPGVPLLLLPSPREDSCLPFSSLWAFTHLQVLRDDH